MVDQQIARYACHPRCESAMSRPVASQRAIDPEENILRQVLGFRAVSGEPVANVKHAPAVSAHKFLPGRPVALEALLDQLGILLQRIISLLTCYGARRLCESARRGGPSGSPSRPANYGTQNAPQMFPWDHGLTADRYVRHLTQQTL